MPQSSQRRSSRRKIKRDFLDASGGLTQAFGRRGVPDYAPISIDDYAAQNAANSRRRRAMKELSKRKAAELESVAKGAKRARLASIEAVTDLENELYRAKQQMALMKKKIDSSRTPLPAGTPHNERKKLLGAMMEDAARVCYPRYSKSRKAGAYMDCLHGGTAFGKASVEVCENFVRLEAKKFFVPYRVLRAVDMCPGGATNPGMLGSLAQADPKKTKRKRSIVPSPSALYQLARRFEAVCNEHVAMIYEPDSPAGETVRWDYAQLLWYLIESHHPEVRRGGDFDNLVVGVGFDGMKLTDQGKGACMAVFKLVDRRSVHPVTGEKLFEDSDGNIANVQSPDHCFPAKVVSCEESKENVRLGFLDFFLFCSQVEKYGLVGRNNKLIRHIEFVHVPDISATQKITHLGGAFKNCAMPCHYCGIHDSEILDYREGDERCEVCLERNWERCRHWDVDDEEKLDEKESELMSILAEKSFDTLIARLPGKRGAKKKRRIFLSKLSESEREKIVSEICNLPGPMWQYLYLPDELPYGYPLSRVETGADALREYNPHHIDFHYPEERGHPIRAEFSDMIVDELEMRGLSVRGTLEDYVPRLKEAFATKQRVKHLRRVLSRWQEKSTFCMIDIARLLTDILHFKNRSAEKIIYLLCERGWESRSGKARLEWAQRVEDAVKAKVGSFQFPMKKNKKALKAVKLKKGPALKVIDSLEELIPVILEGHCNEEKNRWCHAIGHYRVVIKWLRKKDDFSLAEIKEFQEDCDACYEFFISLCGKSFLTNYLHIMGES